MPTFAPAFHAQPQEYPNFFLPNTCASCEPNIAQDRFWRPPSLKVFRVGLARPRPQNEALRNRNSRPAAPTGEFTPFWRHAPRKSNPGGIYHVTGGMQTGGMLAAFLFAHTRARSPLLLLTTRRKFSIGPHILDRARRCIGRSADRRARS